MFAREEGWRVPQLRICGRGSTGLTHPPRRDLGRQFLRGAPASCRGAETSGARCPTRPTRSAPGPCLLLPTGRRRLRCWTATFCSPRTWTTPGAAGVATGAPAPLQVPRRPGCAGRTRPGKSGRLRTGGRGRGRGRGIVLIPSGWTGLGVLRIKPQEEDWGGAGEGGSRPGSILWWGEEVSVANPPLNPSRASGTGGWGLF